ncbi:MAG: RNA polymerase sigma factor [Candidatus Pacebacteria bacterium]|nr:RNA polymerase sigma factor [Candidatus Paceibacterota bacterium]
MDELAIIQKCQGGDMSSFEELYDAYVEKIYRFLYYRTKSKETAEDLTSETFFKAMRGIARANDIKQFGAWLYKIANNTLIDHYRTQKHHASLDDEEVMEVKDPQNIERDSENKFVLEQVRKELKKLTDIQQQIVTMRVWDDLSYKEIAEIVGKTEGNCKVIFSRATAQLRKTVPLAAFILFVLTKQ